MNAALYARYSSELQRATSIQDQIRLCRQAAKRRGYTVADEHVYTDEEISAAIGNRPGYQRLLAAATSRAFDAIIVEAQDRLWRDAAEMYAALKRLRFWGVRVFSVATDADLTGRAGKILAAVVGLKDELFLEDLSDKTRRGMQGAVHRGLSAGGRAYGYLSEPVRDATGAVVGYRRSIDPHEAEVVRQIYRLYGVDGLTSRAIAHRLNAERVPSPRSARGRRSGSWTPGTITGSRAKGIGILRNPIYVGKLVWNRSRKVRDPDTGKRTMRVRPSSDWVWVDAPDLRIIPDELWERVQSRRRQRAWTGQPGTHGSKPKYLLSGLLKCGSCGANYVVQYHRTGEIHYGCAVHHDRGPTVCGNARLVRRSKIEQLTLEYVFGGLFTPARLDYLTSAVNAALAQAFQHAQDNNAEHEVALRQARQELANIAAAIRQGIITSTTKTMLEDAERRVAHLEQAIRGVRRLPPPVVSVRAVVERYLRDLRATFGANVDAARHLLSLALDKIVLNSEGQRLVASFCGNLTGVLRLEPEMMGSVGAGRGI